MNKLANMVRGQGRRITAIFMVTTMYWVARLPILTPAEQFELSRPYSFLRSNLPEVPGALKHGVRNVHPSLQKICAWISSVGASVALNDIDHDGLPNDVVYVDPRTDQVIVGPVDMAAKRYEPFVLKAAPLPYDTLTTAPMGVVPADFNEDGFIDILVYYWGRTPVIFLRNREAGDTISRAAFQPCEVVTTGERWFTNCATTADLDGDGHLDIIIGNYFKDGAHILDARGTGTEEMQHSMSNAFNGGRNRLLLWAGMRGGANPGVIYRDASDALADDVAHAWTLACGACDLDGDLLPEIYFANDFGPDRLLHNRSTPGNLKFALLEGERTLGSPKSKVLGKDSFKGMGVDFADVNFDGHPDIYVSNIAGQFALEESHFLWMSTGEISRMRDGVAPYIDQSEPLGLSRSNWGWDSKLADMNNDGTPEALQAIGFVKGTKNRWPELHELATSNDQLLCNPGSWLQMGVGDDLSGKDHIRLFALEKKHNRYFDVADEAGLGRKNVTRGIAIADVDADGKLDLAVANQWDTSHYYHNVSKAEGSFLGLHLLLPIDPGSGTTTRVHAGAPVPTDQAIRAIGATVRLHLPDGRIVALETDGGNGHSGRRSPDIHFGLGSHPRDVPVKVEIAWRDRGGMVHRETLSLKPGWQTVILGSSQTARRLA